MNSTKLYPAGEKSCEHCGDQSSAPFETWKGHAHYYCAKQECIEAARERDRAIYVDSGQIQCHLSTCNNFIPEGSYGKRTKHFVCSMSCWEKMRYQQFGKKVMFLCDTCGIDVFGQHTKSNRHFCPEHTKTFRLEENLARVGDFRPLYDRYFSVEVLERYRGKSIPAHRQIIVTVLSYLVEVGITDFNDVTPVVISSFLRWGKEKGYSNLGARISHAKVFFDWLVFQGEIKINPVVSSFHRKKPGQRLPRPYDADTLAYIWKLLEERGNSRLRAEASIAEWAGLRRDEIGALRLSDVNLEAYQLFVRLPNKTMTEAYVYFGEETKKRIMDWLDARDPLCGHDFLFHNKEGSPCQGAQMHLEFARALCKTVLGKVCNIDGLDHWSIHRMRHTMASRMAANGANELTIRAQGRWKSASGMHGYTRIDPEDTRRGYNEAMARFIESEKLPPLSVPLTLSDILALSQKAA